MIEYDNLIKEAVNAISRHDLEQDLWLLSHHKKMSAFPDYTALARCKITNAIERLSKFDADMVLIIPIKSGSTLETVFRNLAQIELPLKTGVIIALDQLHTINREWLDSLSLGLRRFRNRFVFSEILHTTPEFVYGYRVLIDEESLCYREKIKSIGLTDVYTAMWKYYIVREELRVIQ